MIWVLISLLKPHHYGTGNESDKLMIIEVCDLNRPEAKYRLNVVSVFLFCIVQNMVIMLKKKESGLTAQKSQRTYYPNSGTDSPPPACKVGPR
jgi:hypothetical protein